MTKKKIARTTTRRKAPTKRAAFRDARNLAGLLREARDHVLRLWPDGLPSGIHPSDKAIGLVQAMSNIEVVRTELIRVADGGAL